MLRFSTAQSTELRVTTLLVMPNGALEVSTASNPIPASFSAQIIIKSKALDITTDPDQYGTGLPSFNGKVTMHGAAKTPTFVRTAVEPRADKTTITFDRAVSRWRVGDRGSSRQITHAHPERGVDLLPAGSYQCSITYSASGNSGLTGQVAAAKEAMISAPVAPTNLRVE